MNHEDLPKILRKYALSQNGTEFEVPLESDFRAGGGYVIPFTEAKVNGMKVENLELNSREILAIYEREEVDSDSEEYKKYWMEMIAKSPVVTTSYYKPEPEEPSIKPVGKRQAILDKLEAEGKTTKLEIPVSEPQVRVNGLKPSKSLSNKFKELLGPDMDEELLQRMLNEYSLERGKQIYGDTE